MNTLKKVFIVFAPFILAAWFPASTAWAGTATVTVPEPSTLFLLAGGIGVGALARYLRNRK